MSFINRAPFLFGPLSVYGGSTTITKGVTDPNGGILATRVAFDSSLDDGGISLGSGVFEASTNYTISFYAKRNGVADTFEVRIVGDVDATFFTQSVTVTDQWAEYSYTFDSATNTVLESTSRLQSGAIVSDLEIDFSSVRIYKTADADPDPLNNLGAGTIYDEVDFSESTTGASPTGWTERFAQAGAYTVREDVSYTGGKYLEHTKASTSVNGISYDAVNADASRNNGVVRGRLLVVTGESLNAPEIMLRGSGAASSENLSRVGLQANSMTVKEYNNGSFADRSSTVQVKNAVTFTENTLWNIEVKYAYDAVIVRVWESTYPENPNYVGGVTILEGDWTGFHSALAGDHNWDTFQVATGNKSLQAQPISGTVDLAGTGTTSKVIVIESDDTAFTNASVFEVTDSAADGTYTTTATRTDGKQYTAFAHKIDGADIYSSQAKQGEE